MKEIYTIHANGKENAAIFRRITRTINGSTNGQADREALYRRAKKVIA